MRIIKSVTDSDDYNYHYYTVNIYYNLYPEDGSSITQRHIPEDINLIISTV
jgi:hypothetical protein